VLSAALVLVREPPHAQNRISELAKRTIRPADRMDGLMRRRRWWLRRRGYALLLFVDHFSDRRAWGGFMIDDQDAEISFFTPWFFIAVAHAGYEPWMNSHWWGIKLAWGRKRDANPWEERWRNRKEWIMRRVSDQMLCERGLLILS
jgi:hypothetical protein